MTQVPLPKIHELPQDQQAKLLNNVVKTRIAPSSIHGVGIFAITNILKGTKLYLDNRPDMYSLKYENFNLLAPKVKELILSRWPSIVEGSRFIYPDACNMAYMNHSDDSNYDNVSNETKRDIMDGEEITEDYRNIAGYTQVFAWIK